MRVLRQEKGMVLLLVLVVVALLSALLTEWAFSTHVDMRLTETFRDSTRAWYLGKGGVEAGRIILQNDTNSWDHPSELWGQGIPGYPIGENGSVSITIEDLNGKINLNSLMSGANVNSEVREILTRLLLELSSDPNFSSPDTPDDLVAALIDWLDTEPEVYQAFGTGAESSYYQGLQNPYPAKDAPLDSLEELQMVRGFTPEVVRLLKPHVTVYGNTTININTASPEVLQAFSINLQDYDIENIVNYREDQPIEKIQDLQTVLGSTSPAYSDLAKQGVVQISVKSNVFRVTALGRIGDGTRQVSAVVSGSGKDIYYVKVD